METMAQLIDTLTAISVVIIAGASFVIIGIAGISAIRMKTVRWDALGFALVILWLIPIGIKTYGVTLMEAATEATLGMVEVAPGFRDAMRKLVSDVAEPWDGENNPDAPVVIATPQFTPTPNSLDFSDRDCVLVNGSLFCVTHTPAPNNFELTATAYFSDFPTAIPQSTPEPTATKRPMIEPTRTAIPSPTVFVCQNANPDDYARGCLPPTPVPGN